MVKFDANVFVPLCLLSNASPSNEIASSVALRLETEFPFSAVPVA